MAMADKIKMSDNNNPGELKNEDVSKKTGGRRSTEKPQLLLYKPNSGMTLKRSEPAGNESWRSSKSPSPSPAELQSRNRQNQKVENKIDCSNIDKKLQELNITTDSQVIDLTTSSEEKKRVKKPEQPRYVAKPAKLDWAAQVDDISPVDSRDKNRSKKKPKRKPVEKFEEQPTRFQPTRNPPPRARDSKSMEHNWTSKSPQTRRNPPVENLPPRLQKKYMMENKGYTHIGGYSEEDWDGGSLSFTNHGAQSWTNTVPPPRGRGRGRVDPERRTTDQPRWNDEKRQEKPTSSVDLDKIKATVSAPGIIALNSTPGKKIDWTELVETSEISRSSSQNSLNQANFPVFELPEKRRKRGKERSDSGNRRRDRRTSEESSGRGSSRERSDWRRRDDDNWRKSASEDSGSWRSNTPAAAPARGFLHVPPQPQRQLFDPMNPARPIIVSGSNVRAPVSSPSLSDTTPYSMSSLQLVNSSRGYPMWNGYPNMQHQPHYHDSSMARHPRHLEILKDLELATMNIYFCLSAARQTGVVDVKLSADSRASLRHTLMSLLVSDLKFCLTEQIAHHIWTYAYYVFIEALKELINSNPDQMQFYKDYLVGVIDEGSMFFEKLIQALEETYNFKVDDFLTETETPEKSHLVGMAVNMAQQILVCLGDLARYKDDANNGANYGKSKMYYSKAQMLNPEIGRPYYQLGAIATKSKRKMEAVYYYMRSLMAKKPVDSARDSLSLTFEEVRKKYEVMMKSRVDERVTEKESRESTSLRREIWIHPMGRRRVHRTTSTSATSDSRRFESDDDDLSGLTGVELNRRFTASFLTVHGKLFTKVGMERFQDAAIQMLREFRAILNIHPLPFPLVRFLQITALNIFSIEHTKLRDPPPEDGYRSAVQMNALIASMQMLNLMLERCLSLLKQQVAQNSQQLHQDVLLFLPAIKIWCDWMLTHGSLWTPPPFCDEFRVGPAGDCWVRLANLVNFLEEHSFWKVEIVTVHAEGYEPVKLPEDNALRGFTPLNLYDADQVFTPSDTDMESARCCLRFRKILFFAEEFLCGMTPPILKMQQEEGRTVFISVANATSPSPTNPVGDDQSDAELMVESFSEGEDENDLATPLSDDSDTIRLLHRKEVLERRHLRQERHRKRVQALMEQNGLSVVLEVRPRYLVPDTNCFIDYLPELKRIASATAPQSTEPCYILNVPLTVVTELEGLSRGGRHKDKTGMSLGVQAHNATVSEDAKEALAFLRTRALASVRCVTPSGKVLKSFNAFAIDGETDRYQTNDDKILATCLSLCKQPIKEETTKPGVPRRLTRDVVLLTEDRHLRVKAYARDLPVRKIPDFIQWDGSG